MNLVESPKPLEPTFSPETSNKPNIVFGAYLPEKFITNEQIERWDVKTQNGKRLTASYIHEKIGISRRFRAGKNETSIDMGIKAALATGNLEDVTAIIVSTSYPLGKNVSEEIGHRLQIRPKFHLDVHAACSGFTRGLSFIKEHERKFNGKRILFIATEKYSHTLANLNEEGIAIDPSMAQTIFSDGAVAIVFTYGKDIQVLEYCSEKLPKEFDEYIRMPIDKALMIPPFLEEPIPTTNDMFQQDGPKVFEELKLRIPSLNTRVIEKARLSPSDIKLVILHQASGRMVKWLAQRMPDYTFFNDLEDGNFSSASIPKALMKAVNQGEIKRGDNLVLAGFGAGLFASTVVVRFG